MVLIIFFFFLLNFRVWLFKISKHTFNFLFLRIWFLRIVLVSQSTQHYETCGFGIIPELHSLDKWIWNDSRVTFIPEAVCFLINFEESRTHHGVMPEENCHCWLFTSLISHQLRYLVSHLWFKQGTGTVTFNIQTRDRYLIAYLLVCFLVN